jgi:HCOMODA/2-hydroxy-3-carboxy-muconic semialdehyde decarboxylase
MLVSNPALGKSLAQTLGDKPVVLMRGPWRRDHRAVGQDGGVPYYTDVNAKLQSQAMALGGEATYLTPGEGEKGDKINFVMIDRIWNLWRMRVLPTLATGRVETSAKRPADKAPGQRT